MEIKLNQEFKDKDGKVMNAEKECCILKPDGSLAKTSDGNYVIKIIPTPDEKVILKRICINALISEYTDEVITPDEKYEKYLLFQKFHEAKNKIELETDEIVLVKKWIGKGFGTLMMGQAWNMLEGK